ncbi:M16 family metallopeptidase [Longispora albida]|uniref:M16 family metallopeptidase n=1 Tax=Longispora albida TaxID=203523 RepID=UPI00036C4CD3|nr:pitrilysin family protein [Longispora albida]
MKAVPPLTPSGPLVMPERADRTLPNGLKVTAMRRSSVPLAEIRLRVPFARADLANGQVLGSTLLSGTETMSVVDIAAELQAVGGGLSAGADADWLAVSGNSLVDGLDRLLELLAGSLTGAVYPANEVQTNRERIADRIAVARNQPAHLVRAALLKRMYPGHPYAIQTPEPEAVRAAETAALAELHAARVRPDGAILVIVADMDPEKALDSVERALGGWASGAELVTLPSAPELTGGPVTLVDRPGSVQSSIRAAMTTVHRTSPDHAPLSLVNMIYGGYFSSRLVENIRESKGYTYSPHSGIEHAQASSAMIIAADVATEVTGPALMEIMYELGRLSLLAPSEEELEQARQYSLGTLRLGMATQAGLASLTMTLASSGLQAGWLEGHLERLATVSREEVADCARRYLAPTNAAYVVLGEASTIEAPLSSWTQVARA